MFTSYFGMATSIILRSSRYDKNNDLVLNKEEFEDLEDVLTQQM